MRYKLDFKPYQRRFNKPIQVSQTTWALREGILIRLEAEGGALGFGEAAPISWFGTESIADISDYLNSLGHSIDDDTLGGIPHSLSRLRFGIGSALEMLQGLSCSPSNKTLEVCALLPTGPNAQQAISSLQNQGYHSFKWKIGVNSIADEQQWCAQLFTKADPQIKLHLDANCGLNINQLHSWCTFAKAHPQLEYIEQPLPVGQEEAMHEVQQRTGTLIAFDESIANMPALTVLASTYPEAVFTLKPALLGAPQDFAAWRRQHPHIRCIYSSAFETAIGFEKVLSIAASDDNASDPQGLSTNSYLPKDVFSKHTTSPLMHVGNVNRSVCRTIWESADAS